MTGAISALASAIGWALIHFLWQGVLIGCLTAFLLMLLRNAKPQTRYALASAALLSCLILPVTEVVTRLKNATALSQYSGPAAASISESTSSIELLHLANWLQLNIDYIALWWLATVLLLSLRLTFGLFWIHTYGSQERSSANAHWQQRLTNLATQFGLQRKIILRVVNDLDSPITIGCLRPMVLIPASLLSGMSPQLLEALLAHELAHISRFDFLVNLIQNLIEMLLFFHPVVWWISKNIRNEREQIADDLAARILGEPRRLALALQELELLQFSTSQLALAAHGGNLMSRIK